MFGIDFSEIAVIFLVALIVLGPEKLPKVAETIGRWVGRARLMARQFRDQLEHETQALRPEVLTGLRSSEPQPAHTARPDQATEDLLNVINPAPDAQGAPDPTPAPSGSASAPAASGPASSPSAETAASAVAGAAAPAPDPAPAAKSASAQTPVHERGA